MQTVFDRLVSHFRTQTALAEALRISPQAISGWKRRGVPADRALEVERLTKGAVSAKEVLKDGPK